MSSPSLETDKRSLSASWLTLNVVLLVLVGLLSLSYPVTELSRRLGDAYFRLRGSQSTSQTVVLVLIDDASLEREGRWPWPRTRLANLVRAIGAQHPAVLGLDVLLTEAGDKNGDDDLAQAIHDCANVVLATKLSTAGGRRWSDPLPLFRSQAAGLGHAQAVMDPDGIARRVPLIELSADGPRWPLAVEMALIGTGQAVQLTGGSLSIGHRQVPVEGTPRSNASQSWKTFSPQFLLVDFRHQLVPDQPEPPFVVVSAANVLQNGAPTDFMGRSILIGFGASDLSDRISTPVSSQIPMPGVEVHANLLDGLLRGRGIVHARIGPQVLLLLIYSLVSTWLVLRRPGWESLWIPIILLVASYVAGFFLFSRRGILLDFGPMLCAGVLAVPLAQVENLVIVNRALNRGLQQLRRTLSSSSVQERSVSLRPVARAQEARDLPHKLDLIQKLQSELASLYAFRQNLLESMQEGLAVFDHEGRMEFCNPFWETFCGEQSWNAEASLIEFGQRLGHPRWSDLSQQMASGTLPPESEVHLGNGFWQVRALRVAAPDIKEPRWMVVVTDLTSRLERDQARAEALRFVTHELRTPLVSIQGFAEFLLRYPKAPGSSEAAATVFRESQRLVSLINTYLDVLRYDAGARTVRRDPVDIRHMVAQVEKVMAPIAESAEIRIKVEQDAILPALLGDTPMLAGVLLNLLNNAVKYSPEGSEVALCIRGVGDAIVFEVSNPGEPIAREDLSRLFEPFYRVREHEASKPGWGLGLTFVKRIVEEHHGSIEAKSDASGIHVRVRFPSVGSETCPNYGAN